MKKLFGVAAVVLVLLASATKVSAQDVSYHYWFIADANDRMRIYVSEVVGLPYSQYEIFTNHRNQAAKAARAHKCQAFLDAVRDQHGGNVVLTGPCPSKPVAHSPGGTSSFGREDLESERSRHLGELSRSGRITVVNVRVPND